MPGKVLKGAGLGKGSVVEDGAVIGYVPARKVPWKKLEIGAGAKIRSGTIVYLGTKIGKGFETGHNAVIREENEFGDDCQVWSQTIIDYGCRIGNGVHIHSHVYISQFTTIEDGVFIAPRAVLLNDPHPGCRYSRQCMRGPTIKKNAVIGGGSVILPMVTIGEGAVIGGGSVVTKDVPAGAVVYGNPARVHGRKESLKCRTGHTVWPYKKAKGK